MIRIDILTLFPELLAPLAAYFEVDLLRCLTPGTAAPLQAVSAG